VKNNAVKTLFLVVALVLNLGFFDFTPAYAASQLIRAKDFKTVYYLDSQNIRHSFPNELTYQSWYGNDFSHIVTVADNTLAGFPLGKNITIRPGTYLVKVQTSPKVYSLEQGGVLREIENEDIAKAIYGQNWNKKIVDIPDVFFENYQIGLPIVHDYTIPDNILFQDKSTKKYYYKTNDLLREFKSVQDVLANNLRLSDAIVSSRSFAVRTRPIVGQDKNIFNPAAKPITPSRDCENKKLKVAMIFLPDGKYTAAELQNLELIKNQISSRFFMATNGLAEVDVSYPANIMFDDGYFLVKNNDGTAEVKNEVINSFYDNNEDIFDFIFVWTNFKTPAETTNEIAHFIPVTNKVEGIGKPIFDRSSVYGSVGKLKGIIMMGNINKYDPQTSQGLNQVLNVAMHEILHNWAAYISFSDASGNLSKNLLRPDDFQHWNIYNGFISPLGGSGWFDNGNGSFTSGLTKLADTNLRSYSKLDLYLMGLIPAQLMDSVMYLVPKKENETGNEILAQPEYVTINQIIKANGKVQCGLD
jgi:hypothetical protein